MTTIASASALLHEALQDLYAGKTDQAARLPGIAAKGTDPVLIAVLRSEAERVARQAARIEAAGVAMGHAKNLWIGGILDDAERDTRQTQPGRLLDVALVGAIRKAKAAEIVSSETAMALADVEGDDELLAIVSANRAEEIETDRRLKERLAASAGNAT